MRKTTTLCLIAVLAGCATPPGRIEGIKNSGPCTSEDKARLTALTKQQQKAANGDALGVFLIGLPVGSMGGNDHEAEIALLKGRCVK